ERARGNFGHAPVFRASADRAEQPVQHDEDEHRADASPAQLVGAVAGEDRTEEVAHGAFSGFGTDMASARRVPRGTKHEGRSRCGGQPVNPIELPPPPRRRRRLERSGWRRAFDVLAAVSVATYVVLWAWAVFDAVGRGQRPGIAARIARAPLDPAAPPPAAYLLDAALQRLTREAVTPAFGESGE